MDSYFTANELPATHHPDMHRSIPETLRTARLLMRPWQPTDAERLLPILEANVSHLAPWIPERVSTPAPVSELARRLAGFAEDFAARRAFRYALFSSDGTQLFGEADMFPRSASGRVPLDDGDHVELGYWLASSQTGKGFASEATRALLEVAERLPGMTHAEIRCDAANVASAAVPRRLGFHLHAMEGGDQVWRTPLNAGTNDRRTPSGAGSR